MARSGRLQPPFFIARRFLFGAHFFTQRGNHEKENRCSCARCSAGRSARRLALGHRAAPLAVEQAEREGVLQVQLPVEIQLVVLLESEVHLMPHRRI